MNDRSDLEDDSEYKAIKAESVLPTKTVGIESLKESNPETMSPHRNIFKWFARRPTAATRLAILSSVLPQDVSNDELLDLMCIGPRRNVNRDITDYVLEKFASKNNRSGSIEEHFGYEYPHRNVPPASELEELHDQLRSQWNGDLPTVIDPTAGGGTIPLESLRYGLPTVSNELNPVAWLINKVILEYAPEVGSVESDIQYWMDEIEDYVRNELEDYFPDRNGISPSHYYRAYSISCPSCGSRIPISNRWYFNRRRNAAVYPKFTEGELTFEVIDPSKVDTRESYDPNQGTVSGGDAECPHCGVVTERSDLVEIFKNGSFEFEVCGVRYEEEIGGTKYHSPIEEDVEAVEKAEEKNRL
ncbi:DUF1156 domain-containing protein [Halapricum sp. CBA1109]|uniref:DUF1156 domain-containing protein n=1 Tax=Halapricum sp. CBA1109 TaxID=2668068 RepID=UPI0012FBB9B7|nr:DUF1156 domain-containing protein [Halapricum sp. CBA1109]MUV88478.1 DUF1156 domain-containing protein [Halapricum sp. CBA1109]